MGSFADDINFWLNKLTGNVTVKKKRRQLKLLQNELTHFQDWTRKWRLVLNPSKCFYTLLYKNTKSKLFNEFIKLHEGKYVLKKNMH